MQDNNDMLSEGLRQNDLSSLISNVFEIDTYRSKMGEDRDICVLTFQVKDRSPAKDLMEFIEKGFPFVLDADVSSGENFNGDYFVFVELQRSSRLVEHIKELAYGVEKLSGIQDWQFKYYKFNRKHNLDEITISENVPTSPSMYDRNMNRFKVEEVKSFFNKTLMDDLTLENSVITIHKPYNQQIKLRWLNEDDPQAVVEGAMSIDSNSTAEVFWLTKVLGDYDISKFEDKFLFTNGDRAMLLQRID
jgi:hypothetical protein